MIRAILYNQQKTTSGSGAYLWGVEIVFIGKRQLGLGRGQSLIERVLFSSLVITLKAGCDSWGVHAMERMTTHGKLSFFTIV
jgi:hypothetical protein